jgi:sugar phosphate isomerase/epimerase
MQISLCVCPEKTPSAPLLFSGDLEAGMKAARDYGYDGVELNLLDSSAIHQDLLMERLDKLDLTAFAIATGRSYTTDGLSLYSRDDSNRRRAVGRLKAHMDFASRLKCMTIIGGIRGQLSSDRSEWSVQLEAGMEALKDCVAYAEEKNVTLLLEPINRYETGVVHTVEEGLSLIETLGTDSMKLLLDTFHMNIEERSMEESLVQAGPLLGYVHFADSNRLAPGQGHIDFPKMVSTLDRLGYTGVIGIEVLPEPDDHEATRQAIRFLRPLLSS